MSYIRFGEEGSEVYVFAHIEGWYDCCMCALAPGIGESFQAETVDDMLIHLYEHRAVGHCVPDSAIQRLMREREIE